MYKTDVVEKNGVVYLIRYVQRSHFNHFDCGVRLSAEEYDLRSQKWTDEGLLDKGSNGDFPSIPSYLAQKIFPYLTPYR